MSYPKKLYTNKILVIYANDCTKKIKNNRFIKNSEAKRQDLIQIKLSEYFEKSANKDTFILLKRYVLKKIKILISFADHIWEWLKKLIAGFKWANNKRSYTLDEGINIKKV